MIIATTNSEGTRCMGCNKPLAPGKAVVPAYMRELPKPEGDVRYVRTLGAPVCGLCAVLTGQQLTKAAIGKAERYVTEADRLAWETALDSVGLTDQPRSDEG